VIGAPASEVEIGIVLLRLREMMVSVRRRRRNEVSVRGRERRKQIKSNEPFALWMKVSRMGRLPPWRRYSFPVVIPET